MKNVIIVDIYVIMDVQIVYLVYVIDVKKSII